MSVLFIVLGMSLAWIGHHTLHPHLRYPKDLDKNDKERNKELKSSSRVTHIGDRVLRGTATLENDSELEDGSKPSLPDDLGSFRLKHQGSIKTIELFFEQPKRGGDSDSRSHQEETPRNRY